MSDQRFPGVMGAVLLRTRFIDEYLLEQVKSGTQQVANLGAGYDTRPMRFPSILKKAVIFEVDHPATQDRKLARIETFSTDLSNKLAFVPVHFNRDDLKDRLVFAGFRFPRESWHRPECGNTPTQKPSIKIRADFIASTASNAVPHKGL